MNFPECSIPRYLLVLATCFLVACERGQPLVTVTGKTMGTTWSVKVVSSDIESTELKAVLDDRLVKLNDVFSTYISDSELSVLNRTSGTVEMSDELTQVVNISRDIYEISEGAFDVTVGPLVNLWGFGPEGPVNGVPAEAEIADTLGRIGFSRVTIKGNQLTKPDNLSIDLSAVAKGYAVDVIAGLLDERGETRYLVEIGGEVKTRGLNDRDQPWVIGVEAPDMEIRRLYGTIPVTEQGMATSGDYRNYFEHEGQVYSHTLDPSSGWPVSHNLASVTVLHESAAYADGLATAFSVLGLNRTMVVAEANNLKVFAIIRGSSGFESVTSRALGEYLANNRR